MTTIAWDGKCMAADRMVTFGTTPMAMKKLFRIKFDGKDAIVGMSGTADEWQPVIEWLQDRRKTKPDVGDKREWSAMMVLRNGDVYYFAGLLTPLNIGKVRWAIGSGGDYALGAMDFGASAQEAVAIASGRDNGTGLGVDVEGFD